MKTVQNNIQNQYSKSKSKQFNESLWVGYMIKMIKIYPTLVEEIGYIINS